MTSTVALIPAYNEERSIAKVIVVSKKYSEHVIVCDDGSTDLTGEIASQLGARVIRHKERLGKGAALRDLVDEAKKLNPDVVVTIDADLQHDPAEIPLLVEPVANGEADIAIGVRDMKSAGAPKGRILGNKFLSFATSAKAGKKISDSQSGFRAYSIKALESLEFSADGLSTESQTLIDAVKSGLRIKEVDVSTTYRNVRKKRSAVGQLVGITDYLLSRTVAESPLLYIGLPGLVGVIAGIAAGFRVIGIFLSTHQIAVGTGLVSLALVIMGSIMLATSLMIKLLKMQRK